ncbi:MULTISPECIES: TetR/AcrR family transcriptional regulator [Mycobacterium]|uniref:TetR family transcriptional regulator n=1 Tax=Mycobacterium kiyosense TaxID=2871094 RepID=A0A9P3UVV2_9MYCO|nr:MULTISPECIES: TetR/AcrR family transcriptional regulator [Mycobacterium]BDB42434.1 TetR family transcriptional regulator [Mycobacterium kiyosense]BDE14296.1 TetR family transcriptional regulator [Mycobacterium sp. 20KCMC460]GLB81488.1 TetR family transcriptional regulator [Mycobacterium kiyosense]GLB90085.1 TetR family transcriptional regulator [Mycobacterium kiyosense]GLB93681.1 TetR family transcriptional regulator [Mycobacterium kiyosense]
MPRTSDARDRIVRTAARLFLQRSYHDVGVEELCAAANVRKGSFYHYFSSKSDVAKAVVDLHMQVFQTRLAGPPSATPAQRLSGVPEAIGDIQSALRGQFGRFVGCPFGNLAAELSTTDEEVRSHLAMRLADLERGLAQICRDAAAADMLRDDVDPDRLAHALLAHYQGLILLAKLHGSTVADLAPALHEFLDGHLAPQS